ncbi:hypothetical protein [Ignatzschineria cameli]|nr:hypothetical protein [Ignatzschineria cameli]
MSCRRLPLHTSKNRMPARGALNPRQLLRNSSAFPSAEGASRRACSGEKNEMVGSRLSINSLKNH